MGKRVIQECDLTKQEFDPDETVKLTITRNGKKGRTYELSPDAANKLEQQLVGGSKLPTSWSFGGTSSSEVKTTEKKTLGDLEDDTSFVTNKKSELREAGVIGEKREEPQDTVIAEALGTPRNTDACRHINKGSIQTTLQNGKRFVYRLCRDCQTRIPEMTAEERKSFMSGKISDPGIRSRDLTN